TFPLGFWRFFTGMSVDSYLWFAIKSSRNRCIRNCPQSAGLLPFLISVPGNQPALAETNARQDTLLQHSVDGPRADVEALGDLLGRHAGLHRRPPGNGRASNEGHLRGSLKPSRMVVSFSTPTTSSALRSARCLVGCCLLYTQSALKLSGQ